MQRVPDDVVHRMIADRRLGVKVRTIAKRYGYTVQTVSRYTRSAHVPLAIRRAGDQQIIELLRAGRTVLETVKQTGLTYAKVYRVGRRENLLARVRCRGDE